MWKEKNKPMQEIRERIKSVVPGGIDGNAKLFSGEIPIASRGKGAYVYDANGKQYIDYIGGYGPLLFGHANQELTESLYSTMKNGTLYGLPHELMYKVGEKIVDILPSAEMVRFTNTGTEATLNALRLAKGVTKRDKIIKFYGCYHGTHDFVLIGTKPVTTKTTLPNAQADSAGIAAGVQKDIYTLQFNDSEGFKEFMATHGEEIAAVIVEPIIGSYGIVAEQTFMETLRDETSRYGSLLIFDEIITGFRLGLGGAQAYYGVTPDITTLGKVLGGGIPIGLFAGKKEFMQRIIPQGDPIVDSEETVYHSGTFNANPLALAACNWVITKLINEPEVLQITNRRSSRLREGFNQVMQKHGLPGITVGLDSVFQWYFGIDKEPKNINDIQNAHMPLLQSFHREMVKLGVLFIGSPRGFVSAAHSDHDIEQTIEYADLALSIALDNADEK